MYFLQCTVGVFLTVYCRCIFLAKAQVYTEQCTLCSKVYVCLLSDKLYNIVYPPVIQQILYIIYNTQPLLQYTTVVLSFHTSNKYVKKIHLLVKPLRESCILDEYICILYLSYQQCSQKIENGHTVQYSTVKHSRILCKKRMIAESTLLFYQNKKI